MILKIKSKSMIFLIFILVFTFAHSSTAFTQSINATEVISGYKVSNKNVAVAGENVSVKISIKNVYYVDVANITIKEIIPDGVELIELSDSEFSIENLTDSLDYNLATLKQGETFNLTLIFNVTETEAKTIPFIDTYITFTISEGDIHGELNINSLSLQIRQYEETSEAEPSWPVPLAVAGDIFTIIGYLLPIIIVLLVLLIRRIF